MAKAEIGKVKLRNVRLAFCNLFVAKSFNDDSSLPPKYSASFLMSKTTPEGKANIAAVKAAMKAAYDEKWPKDGPKLKSNQVCLRDGDDESYDGFEGMMYVSANNGKRPQIVDRDPSVPIIEADDKVYSGCIVNATLRIWAQDSDWGKRLNCSVEAVQFVAAGERVGAKAVVPEEEFEVIADDGGASGGEEESPF